MSNEWILDVLTDLRSFARENGMDALAEQLDDAHLLAVIELTLQTKNPCTSDSDTTHPAINHRTRI